MLGLPVIINLTAEEDLGGRAVDNEGCESRDTGVEICTLCESIQSSASQTMGAVNMSWTGIVMQLASMGIPIVSEQ